MKLLFAAAVLLSFSSAFLSAFAQDRVAAMAAESACGPAQINYSATADTNHHPNPQPDPDKALVFVVEDIGQCADCSKSNAIINDVSAAIVKVGADGAWIGAGRGSSYLFFPVEPGEHHLCVNWQSRLSVRARAFAMSNLTAEAGKTYYFRVRLFPGDAEFSFDLEQVNSDEGKYMVASSPLSVSHPKK